MTAPAFTETDIEAVMTRAIVAILENDSGVQGLTGRSEGNIVPEQDLATFANPLLMYELNDPGIEETGAAGRTYLAHYRLTAIAEGNGARSMTAALMECVRNALTQPNLAAQGLNACPFGRPSRRRIPLQSDDTKRAIAGARLDLVFLVTL